MADAKSSDAVLPWILTGVLAIAAGAGWAMYIRDEKFIKDSKKYGGLTFDSGKYDSVKELKKWKKKWEGYNKA